MEMAIKNVYEISIFWPPTVCNYSIPGETVGGGRGCGSKTARSAADCVQLFNTRRDSGGEKHTENLFHYIYKDKINKAGFSVGHKYNNHKSCFFE